MPLRHCPRFFQEPNIKAGSPTTSATTDVACTARCNVGEHSTRHHAMNRAWRAALAAVAVGEVILGDKEKAGEYKKYNGAPRAVRRVVPRRVLASVAVCVFPPINM